MGWFNLVWSSYSDERFKKTFRISRTTFQFILQRIRHVLDRRADIPRIQVGHCSVSFIKGRLLLPDSGNDRTGGVNRVYDRQ